MYLVAHPFGRVFGTVAGLGVVGGVQALVTGRLIVILAQVELIASGLVFFEPILLNPDLAKNLDRGKGTQFLAPRCLVNGFQQRQAITPNTVLQLHH